MNKKKDTVLVSGGAGYIGTHTTVALIEAGYDVVMIDNFSNSEPSAVEGVEKILGRKVTFEECNTCDIDALRGVFERHEFSTVIHFAAYKAVGESMSEPLKYYQNNLVSYMNILQLMKEFKRPNILFSSSATVYGDAEHLPVTEETPRQPATSPYGNTKQIAEDILRDCCAAYEGMYGIALRLLQPHRCPSLGTHRRAASRRAQQPAALRYPDSRRPARMSVGVRQRLRYSRRHMPARLYRRCRPCQGPRCRRRPHDRGQDGGKIRNLQHRHRPPRVGTRTAHTLREGQQPQTPLQNRRTPPRRRACRMGRHRPGK